MAEQETPKRRKFSNKTIGLAAAVVLVLGGLIGAFAFILTDTGGPKVSTVPTVVGMSQAAAGDALRAAQLTPQFTQRFDNSVPANTVISANPPAGATLSPDATVAVVLSKGRPIVPAIAAGTSVQDAQQRLQQEQLTPTRGTDEFSGDVPQGAVIRTDPAAGSQLVVGGSVALIVSKGPIPLPPVPDVTGLPQDQAFQQLQQAGFTPFKAGEEPSDEVQAGSVTRTDPPAGSTATSQRIGVFLSNAVQVPDVRFHTFDDAEKILKAAGLQADRNGGGGHGHGGGGGNFGFVFEQDPAPGTVVPKGTKVKIKGVGE